MRKGVLVAALAAVAAGGVGLLASDHDDGENDVKARSLNLTDLYVFREGDQTGVAGDNANLIFIMNTNPRSLPRQQYTFSTRARYELHMTRRAGATDPVTGADDVTLRFEFGPPDPQNRQPITVTAILDGQTLSTTARSDNGQPILSTPLSAGAPTANPVQLGGQPLTVFAGLREDPFFFDVEQFFRVRGGAAGSFRPPATAVDFTAGYNVNAIVVRVPIAFLAGAGGATTFDVWETISIPN